MTIDHEEPAAAPIAEPPITHNVELAISYTLRIGLLLCVLLVALGTVLTFYHHPEYVNQAQSMGKVPEIASFPTTLSATWASVINFRGQGLILLGLLVLLATPVVRVIICVIFFALQRKWIFVAMAAFVLTILILSYFLGKAEG